jgi:plastocyanin
MAGRSVLVVVLTTLVLGSAAPAIQSSGDADQYTVDLQPAEAQVEPGEEVTFRTEVGWDESEDYHAPQRLEVWVEAAANVTVSNITPESFVLEENETEVWTFTAKAAQPERYTIEAWVEDDGENYRFREADDAVLQAGGFQTVPVPAIMAIVSGALAAAACPQRNGQ